MALFKIGDRFPDYQERYLDGNEIKGTPVYADVDDEKVGNVHDVLVDEEGRIRYLALNIGFWIFGKTVLLPIGRCTDPTDGDRIYANGLTKAQVENLPEYRDELVVDYDYEEQVRSVYRMPSAGGLGRIPVGDSVPVEMSAS
ncbi:MAG: PRC-barrel domain-containing protein, partial [Elainellaceae cyanobacterium]